MCLIVYECMASGGDTSTHTCAPYEKLKSNLKVCYQYILIEVQTHWTRDGSGENEHL